MKWLYLFDVGVVKDGVIKVMGGGVFKFVDVFKECLGVIIDKEDEMGCLVVGVNFLLCVIRDEVFIYLEG